LSLTERLFGLNREADDYLGRTVENLKKMVAGQATELAFSPSTGIQFNAAIASAAFRADDIGLSHGRESTRPAQKGPVLKSKGTSKELAVAGVKQQAHTVERAFVLAPGQAELSSPSKPRGRLFRKAAGPLHQINNFSSARRRLASLIRTLLISTAASVVYAKQGVNFVADSRAAATHVQQDYDCFVHCLSGVALR
jgi:hypothetical protein